MISRKSLWLFVLFLGFLPLFAHAAQEYTVVKGDNLWSISRRHNLTVKELKTLNKFTGSALKIGQKLVISSPRVETPEVKSNSSQSSFVKGGPQGDSVTRTEKVQQKAYWADVLSKKVTEYAEGILDSEKSEIPLNPPLSKGEEGGLEKKHQISQGAVGTQVLTGDQVKQAPYLDGRGPVPVAQVPPGSQVSAGNETPYLDGREPVPVSTPQEYTVRKGDNLWSIAKRHGITVKELRAWNNLTGNSLRIGQELIVSTTEREESRSREIGSNYRTEKVYHKIKKGDTLAKIARKYGTGVPELKRLNNLSNTRISTGKRLLVKVSKVRVPSAEEPTLEVANNKPVDKESELPPDLDGAAAKLLQSAFEFVGVPYRLGGFSQLGIDCSGLVKKAFSAIGIDLPRTARTQFLKGEPVAFSDLLPGDLLFFTTRKARYPTHVAIYLGKGLILHASRSNRRVMVDNFEKSGYFRSHFIGARRVLSEPDVISPVEASE
ncbi:MAG: LysM peptidoglycan-binding domain-containing protein [Candidatus Omnitrophota bacterium]